jgi:PhzF family phenazine biosynthesis protein
VAELDILKLDVFSEELYAGNPSWIVMNAEVLDDMLMQSIANELGAPETAFVLKSKKADVRLRYFTSSGEEPISGHSTVGALWALAERNSFGSIHGGRHRVETPIGVLPFRVEILPSGAKRVWMTQRRPLYSSVDELTEIASALGIGAEMMFHREFPISKVSTGLPSLIVPMRSLDLMGRLSPRQDELVQLCQDLEVGSVMVYTWGGFDQSSTLNARCFLPAPVFHEDPASGMPAGGLAAYLVEKDFIPKDRAEGITVEQGHFVGRPSRIHVRVEKHGSSIRKVEVGGSVRESIKGSISLP